MVEALVGADDCRRGMRGVDRPGASALGPAPFAFSSSATALPRRMICRASSKHCRGHAATVTVEATAITANNFSLEDHWNQGSARATVAKGNWSFVVLQQGPSALPESRVLLREYARRFAGEARKTGARTALYMVWPAKARSRDFDAVSESYALAARDVDGVLIPAGDAWREVWRRDPRDGPLRQRRLSPERARVVRGGAHGLASAFRRVSRRLARPSSISSGLLPLLQEAADRATAVSGSASRSGGPR